MSSDFKTASQEKVFENHGPRGDRSFSRKLSLKRVDEAP